MQLLDLPAEIILACFCELPFSDLNNLFQVGNQHLYTLLHESVIIRYRAELEAADVEENLHLLGGTAISDRRKLLRERERRWIQLTPLSRHTIRPDFTSASIYDVVGDIYLVGDTPDALSGLPTAIRYTYTSPSSLEEENSTPAWRYISAQNSKPIIDFVVSLASHDLIALVTCSPDAHDATLTSIDIQLLRFSTGARHPLGPPSDIHVTTSPAAYGRPSVSIEVVDNSLAISAIYWAAYTNEHDCLWVYDWLCGKLLLQPRRIANNGVGFLTADTLIAPNPFHHSLEVFSIPREPPPEGTEPPYPIMHSFWLPQLKPGFMTLSFHCRGHPNPPPLSRSATEYYYALPSRAKFPSRGSNSLLLYTFSTGSYQETDQELRNHMFVVDRSQFISAVQAFTTLEDHEDSDATSMHVEWSQWGPQCTRFLDASVISQRYITTTCGQRLVCIARDAQNDPAPIRMLYFNEYAVKQLREDLSSLQADSIESAGSLVRLVEGDPPNATESSLLHSLPSAATVVFDDPNNLISHIPYAEVVSKAQDFAFGALVINDENIIGVKFSGPNLRRLDSLDVLHFG